MHIPVNPCSPEVENDQRRLIKAIKSRLSQPSHSTELTDEELALFEEEESALKVDEISMGFSEQMAKYADLSDPQQIQAFLRDFSAWIEQKRAERGTAIDQEKERR
jgi:hypothetical protein